MQAVYLVLVNTHNHTKSNTLKKCRKHLYTYLYLWQNMTTQKFFFLLSSSINHLMTPDIYLLTLKGAQSLDWRSLG